MIYLIYLGCVYMLYGGTLRNYLRSLAGYPVPEDATPSGRKDDELPQQVEGYASDGGGYASDGPGKYRSDPSLSLLSSRSGASGGGTFKGSYQQVRVNTAAEDDPEDRYVRGVSVSSDGGSVSTVTSFSAAVGDAKMTFARAQVARSWFLSTEDRQILKRRTIKSRLTALGVLSSFISDLDLVSDWCFLEIVLINFPLYLQKAGLVFAISGTVMWALGVTEFALLSKLRVMWRGNPASRLEHVALGWQMLANVVLEDLPQFVITIITKPNSIPGAINLTMSSFSLVSKIIKGYSSTEAPSLSTQFNMIDEDPAVTRHLFELRDEAKKKAKKAEMLVYKAWVYRCSAGQKKAAAVFQVLQMDPTFVNGELDYMKMDLVIGGQLCIVGSGLSGPIPPHLGGFSTLRTLILRQNKLTGTVPKELGTLKMLKELDLADNDLEGEIPIELGILHQLEKLILSGNSLSGPIPSALGRMVILEKLDVHGNMLTGGIPGELSWMTALREMDLSNNELTGPLPAELGALDALEMLSVGNNKLSGLIPTELGSLQRLKSLVVADNMFTEAERTEEELKLLLHPECETDFLPQSEPDPEEDEEATAANSGEEEYASFA